MRPGSRPQEDQRNLREFAEIERDCEKEFPHFIVEQLQLRGQERVSAK